MGRDLCKGEVMQIPDVVVAVCPTCEKRFPLGVEAIRVSAPGWLLDKAAPRMEATFNANDAGTVLSHLMQCEGVE